MPTGQQTVPHETSVASHPALQAPSVQISSPQAIPHAPQFVSSLIRSPQASLHLHVKIVNVDGLNVVITGANPQHAHDYDEPWHDAGFALRGG